ncbi:LuxR family transcriptional regulator [Ornithinibacillus californiensis]|uniref:LuxR family transcriptional regulator n=1 Tax=Ornithinibacillus californiensis TaxID=161536 RepID=UPI001F35CA77|nr:LuxR family transcriptional regulator [Ornithinibacillus californiensis]
MHEGTSDVDVRINEMIHKVEEEFFIGRSNELSFFQEFMQAENPIHRITHFYGEGGIGKTYLLQELARIAKKQQIPFIYLNSQDFTHNVQGFIEYLYATLVSQIQYPKDDISQVTLHDCLTLLNNYDEKIFIAMDTYEHMEDFDRWFRNAFIRQLYPSVRVVLAGRKSLTGEWQESPAWRKVTKQIQLHPFCLEETLHLLNKSGVNDEHHINNIWEFTKGHPLLITLASISDFTNKNYESTFNSNSDILSKLTKRWLTEVTNDRLINIVEVAALFYQFDQSCLSEILNQDIPNRKFNQLTSLSFVRKTRRGWSMHELIRDAIRMELKQRNPDRYELLTNKIVAFYYHRIIKQPTEEDIASFFYHLGDDLIQSIFFQEASIDTTMYLDPIDEYNFHEVEAFFAYQKNNISKSNTKYYNRRTNSSIEFDASFKHNQLESELIGPEYIQQIGYHGASLLKKNGEVIGISINVPVNEQTLPILSKEPVSRAYFGNLSNTDKEYYNVPVEKTTSYFIRYQDYIDPTDNAARSFLLYSLFRLIFSGGKITASTPLKLFQDLLYKFGFQTVPGAEHDDFNEDIPTPTFILDLSGPRLVPYLKQFLQGVTKQNELDILIEKFSLTKREQDIMKLLLEDKIITEIANDLFIAEITVKKALSRIYRKADVKNRPQLIKKIMDII